jgi:hypothetical protein
VLGNTGKVTLLISVGLLGMLYGLVARNKCYGGTHCFHFKDLKMEVICSSGLEDGSSMFLQNVCICHKFT